MAMRGMIDMVKRPEFPVLRRAGHTLEEVANLTGVSKRSVQSVEQRHRRPSRGTGVGLRSGSSRSGRDFAR